MEVNLEQNIQTNAFGKNVVWFLLPTKWHMERLTGTKPISICLVSTVQSWYLSVQYLFKIITVLRVPAEHHQAMYLTTVSFKASLFARNSAILFLPISAFYIVGRGTFFFESCRLRSNCFLGCSMHNSFSACILVQHILKRIVFFNGLHTCMMYLKFYTSSQSSMTFSTDFTY